MLSQLHLSEVQQLPVAIGFTVECIWHERVSIRSWDVGGSDKLRPLYRHFFDGAHAVLFVVDAGDPEQLPRAKREIDHLMAEPELAEAKLVVLAVNKRHGTAATSRAADALTLHQVVQAMDLESARTRDWSAFCVELGQPSDIASMANGVWEAFEWLEQRLQPIYRKPTSRWLRGPSGCNWSDRAFGANINTLRSLRSSC